jgi:uncharacterized protein (TIGR00730 family)
MFDERGGASVSDEIGRVGLVGGAALGVPERYLKFAEELGDQLGRFGVGIVHGGAAVGVMGAAVCAAIAVGGHVTSVVPHALLASGATLAAGSELYVVRTADEGKRLVHRLAQGFVVLPGGLDTVAELSDLVVVRTTSGPAKPIVVLNQEGYFDSLLTLVDHALAEAFVTLDERQVIEAVDTVDHVLHRLGVPLPQPVGAGMSASSAK